MDVLGELLHWGGQLLVSYVLVGLAYGWTLSSRAVQKYIPDDKVKRTVVSGPRWRWRAFNPGIAIVVGRGGPFFGFRGGRAV